MSSSALSLKKTETINVIAVTGCDGSGKSTLAFSLVESLKKSRNVKFMYLGQSSGKIAHWLGDLPLFGKSIQRFLVGKSKKVHNKPTEAPGAATATVIFLLSCWRAFKFYRMLGECRRGTLVITDRYPQDEIPGFRFDGPQLAKTEGGNRYIQMLRNKERQLYTKMASYQPLLVIRLDIDVDTAFSRKPDHAREALTEKIAVYPQLRFSGAPILDLNGKDSADSVLARSLSKISAHSDSH